MIILTDQNFEAEVLKSDLPVLVDFWAPWCGPCQMAGPIIEELAAEYAGKVKVGKINIDENTQTPMKYGVMSIPTVMLFRAGQEVGKEVGFAGKEGYLKLITNS
ncbi:thioredoxin [Candidatus Shapirobacteria bacterium CG09_land_8_20_14_0_10_47_13]|uniref:Thioredoxin n=1 Tax=Candidatus Shapirobacteria bacterium CG09_land_8_20_14_0_10_47_13 TaxID=1974481 RepID=A0A2H0WN33_9BACT|nr:MAG: thioredoxin [Candidatus Shapirobacteria bacterium CG09_land_8_20_14_0_10_47_13]